MSDKKSKKDKKLKKNVSTKDLPPETEYDSMDLEMLKEVVPMLRKQLEKATLDRNYVQLERVSYIYTFESSIAIQLKWMHILLLGCDTKVLRNYNTRSWGSWFNNP